jgi:4-hydroxybenzoate polyprenyltransferase
MKSRIYGLAIWAVLTAAMAASIAWPSTGTANIATLAMVAMNVYFAVAVGTLGATMSNAKSEDAAKRNRALEALGTVMAARDQRTIFGRVWSVAQCVSLAVLAAYIGMLFAALLYAFFSMIIRLQYVAAVELVKPGAAADTPA